MAKAACAFHGACAFRSTKLLGDAMALNETIYVVSENRFCDVLKCCLRDSWWFQVRTSFCWDRRRCHARTLSIVFASGVWEAELCWWILYFCDQLSSTICDLVPWPRVVHWDLCVRSATCVVRVRVNCVLCFLWRFEVLKNLEI
jgi:hypothetical protein